MRAQVVVHDHISYVGCPRCPGLIGQYSKHESAMTFADSHMRNGSHLLGGLIEEGLDEW